MTLEWTFALNGSDSIAIAAFGVLVVLVRPRTPQARVVSVFGIFFGLSTTLVNLADGDEHETLERETRHG